jgi:hypothetical protein
MVNAVVSFFRQGQKNRFLQISSQLILVIVVMLSLVISLVNVQPAQGAGALSFDVEPLTWNVIGLDSNNVNVGPNHFPVGARVCANDAATATVTFHWDDSQGVFSNSPFPDPYINLRAGTTDVITLTFLAAGCKDAYFEAEVTRISAAYNPDPATRSYYITADDGSTITTIQPRELLVEHLISQSRNATTSVEYSSDGSSYTNVVPGGTMSLLVGQTYWIKLTGTTATNGYEQIETFLTLPNTIFDILEVDTTYSASNAGSPIGLTNDKLYADACDWMNNPLSPNYRSCLSTGKNGGGITVTYKVNIRSVGPDPLKNPDAMTSLIYDFSGSSYHYNADFSSQTRYFQIVDYSQVGLKKKFTPSTIEPNGTSTMAVTITNPFNITLNNVEISDSFPANMKTTDPVTYSTSGCGSPTFAPGNGVSSFSFTNGTLYPNGTCTINLTVTAPAQDTPYTNTTGELHINGTNTHKTASADLTVGTVVTKPPSASSCTPVNMASWNFENAGAPTTPSAYTSKVSVDSYYTYAAISGPTTTGLSTAYAYSATHSYSGIGNWILNGYTPITESLSHYEFSVDTRKYNYARITFWLNLQNNGAWASNTNPVHVFTSNDGGDTWIAATPAMQTINKTGWFAPVGPYIAETGTTDNTGALTTIFRIVIEGVKSLADQPSAAAYLDDVAITGCEFSEPPTLSKSFSPDPVQVDSASTLTFTVTNPAGNISTLSGITFEDDLPEGLDVASSTISACSGTVTLTAAAGATPAKISFTRASALAVGGSCTIDVPVTPKINAVFDNVSGYISATESGGNATSTGRGTDTLTAYLPPQITKLYTPDSILTGGTSQLTYVITNPNSFNSLYGINFSDAYAGTMTNTSTLNITNNTCGVTISGSGSGTSIGIPVGENLTLAAGASCTFTVDVTATSSSLTPEAITSGTTVYATGASGSTGATGALALTGNYAEDILYVKALTPKISLLKQVGDSATGPWYNSDVILATSTTIYYKFTVNNIGDVDFTSLSISDSLYGTVCSALSNWKKVSDDSVITSLPVPTSSTVDPAAYCIVGPYTGTVDKVVNTATVTGGTDSYGTATATDSASYQNGNFGHLPAAYENMNLYNDGGAFHLNGSVYFGSAVDTNDLDGINTVTYTPKTTDDGVTQTEGVTWAVGANGGSVDINTTGCSVATPCYVNAWFDFNKDNDFDDPGEQVFTNLFFTTDGWQTLTTFDIPAGTDLNGTIYSRFRIYEQLPTNPQPYSQAYNGTTPLHGEIEDPYFTLNGGVVTPVTLSYFSATRQGTGVTFEWSTSTETGNVGFNLYAEQDGELVQLNNELIPSKLVNSLARQDYSFTANTLHDTFFIEDVSVLGDMRRYGPFVTGEAYGDRLEAETIDWNSIQQEYQAAQTTHGRELRADLSMDATGSSSLTLKVNQTGMYRVTYEMLRDAGLDLKGVTASKVALYKAGQPVPVFLSSKSKFGAGSYFEFYGQALDTIYTDTNVYTLKINRTAAAHIPTSNTRIARNTPPSTSYVEKLVVNRQRGFADYAPGSDLWYDTEMLAYTSPRSWDYSFQVDGMAGPDGATLDLVVWGITDWESASDHHLQASLNGTPLADEWFDGLVEKTVRVNLPAGLLREGENTLRLTLPGDTGEEWDVVALDKFTVTYARSFQARDGRLTFTAAGKAFKVTNLPSADVTVYRLAGSGAVRLGRVTVNQEGSTYSAAFAGYSTEATYLVTSGAAMRTPVFEAVRAQADLSQPAQYLVIAHPQFIAGIQPLVEARRAQGLTVSVVDVNDLYTQYTNGIFDPQAIKDYIVYAHKNLGTQYVLLVGGDTYDYRNYLGINSISFIPSLYVATDDLVKYVPADPLYADVNKDNVPDLAIGRFPVRTAAELEMMVNKTLAYASKDYRRTAVFASDYGDGLTSFKYISNELAATLPAGWSVDGIHLDDQGVTSARTNLTAAMNRGTALVSFTGHSGPVEWTFSKLLTTKTAAALTNVGRPFVVVQWGCWNNYYVDPTTKYLVQSFLFSGENGAAATLGASTLVDSESERSLGLLLMPRLTTPGMTVGQALQDAKASLAQSHPEMLDVLLGWSLMGDPALVIEP